MSIPRLGLLLLSCLAIASPSLATDVHVTIPANCSVAPSEPPDGTAGNPFLTITAALNHIRTQLQDGVADRLLLQPGVYHCDSYPIKIEGTVTDQLTVTPWGAGNPVLDADANGNGATSRVCRIKSGGGKVILQGIIFRNGLLDNPGNGVGAGLYASDRDVDLIDCMFLDNRIQGTGDYKGGGLFLRNGSLLSQGCRFDGNSLQNGGGAGAYVEDAGIADRTTRFEDCVFVRNVIENTDVPDDCEYAPSCCSGGETHCDPCVGPRGGGGAGLWITKNDGVAFPSIFHHGVELIRCTFGDPSDASFGLDVDPLNLPTFANVIHRGFLPAPGACSLVDVDFEGVRSGSGSGAGVVAVDALLIEDSGFYYNQGPHDVNVPGLHSGPGTYGAGLYVENVEGFTEIVDSHFEGNNVPNQRGNGGGATILVTEEYMPIPRLEVHQTKFIKNQAGYYGSGLWISADRPGGQFTSTNTDELDMDATVHHCLFLGNQEDADATCQRSGQLGFQRYITATAYENVIHGGDSEQSGSGIMVHFSRDVHIYNNTITGNRACLNDQTDCINDNCFGGGGISIDAVVKRNGQFPEVIVERNIMAFNEPAGIWCKNTPSGCNFNRQGCATRIENNVFYQNIASDGIDRSVMGCDALDTTVPVPDNCGVADAVLTNFTLNPGFCDEALASNPEECEDVLAPCNRTIADWKVKCCGFARKNGMGALGAGHCSTCVCGGGGGCPVFSIDLDGQHREINSLIPSSETVPGSKAELEDLLHVGRFGSDEAVVHGAIREVENERSWFDLVEMLVAYVQPGAAVLTDDQGRAFELLQNLSPIAAVDDQGHERLAELLFEDGDVYSSSAGSWLEVEFDLAGVSFDEDAVAGPSQRARHKCPAPCDPIGKRPAPMEIAVDNVQDVPAWNSGGGIDVYVSTDRENWTFLRRLAPREWAVSTQLTLERSATRVWMRYYFPAGYHQLDQVGWSISVPLELHSMELLGVHHSGEDDARSGVARSDGVVTRLDPMEAMNLSWQAPASRPGRESHLLLRTRGRYVHEAAPRADEADSPAMTSAGMTAYPNPFNPNVTLRVDVPRRGRGELAIYNAQGELVRVLAEGELESGPMSVRWTGIDARGRGVSSGVYYARFRQGDVAHVSELVLVR